MGKKVTVSTETIQSEEFTGGEELQVEQWIKLVVPNFQNLAPLFYDNWNESPVMFLTAVLSQDCSKIDMMGACLEGKVFNTREKMVPTNKLWNFDQKQVKLKLFPMELSIFKFTCGLYSELVDFGEVESKFFNEGPEDDLEFDDLKRQGYAGFSLRCFLQPISTAQVKASIVMYPVSKDKLLKDHSLAARPEYPGVIVSTITAELGVQRSQVTDRKIGCPVLPVVSTSTPVSKAKVLPAMKEVKAKVAALLQGVRVPELKTTAKSLWERMATIKAGGEAQLENLAPEFIWPKPDLSQSVEKTGICLIKLLI